MILDLARRYWSQLALGLALAAALFFLNSTKGDLSDANAKIATMTAEAALTKTMVEQQNAGIDALKATRDDDRKLYLAGLAAAGKQAVNLQVDAAELLRLPSPATRDEQCAAAEALLRKELTP